MQFRYALAATIAFGLAGCEEPKITEQWEAEANAQPATDDGSAGRGDDAALNDAALNEAAPSGY
jgi:hypothetical protein